MRTNTKLTLVAISIILIALAGFYAIKINTAIAPIDGEHTASTTTETSSPLVRLTTPRPNAEIITPLIVTGEARGNWYFEASFPVRLLDGNGKEIAVVPAQAQGDWMTTDFVPFRAELTFILPNTKEGTLVLEKDNPSGLSIYDDALEIPVVFTGVTGNTNPPPIACTQEAKICPDGSAVGRVGPNCEFAPCP